MRKLYLFPSAILLVLLAACENTSLHESLASPTSAPKESYLASADSVDFNGNLSSLTDGSRKVIHNIQFDCRVNDVYTATTRMETLIKDIGGIVEQSKMENKVADIMTLKCGTDSIRKIQSYETAADMILRVPVAYIDTVMSQVPQLASFINSRSAARQDVTLMYLSNALKNKATTPVLTDKAVRQSRKSGETIEVIDYMENKQDDMINRKISNLAMLDQANYATVHIHFYQPERIDEQVLPDISTLTTPGFGDKFIDAMSTGGYLFTELFLLLVRIWPIPVLAGIGILLLRRKRPRTVITDK